MGTRASGLKASLIHLLLHAGRGIPLALAPQHQAVYERLGPLAGDVAEGGYQLVETDIDTRSTCLLDRCGRSVKNGDTMADPLISAKNEGMKQMV